MSLTINIILPPTFDVGPNLIQQLGAQMATVLEDISADFSAKFDDLKAQGASAQEAIISAVTTATTAQHDQVMQVISDLQGKLTIALGNTTDPAAVQALRDNVTSQFEGLKADLTTKKDAIVSAVTTAVQGVYQQPIPVVDIPPDQTPPTPPEPTPTTPPTA